MGNALEAVTGPAGVVLLLLGLLSILSVTLIVVKVFHFWGVLQGQSSRNTALELWQQGKMAEAHELFAVGNAPSDRVATVAAERLINKAQPPMVEASATRQAEAELASLRRYVRSLDLIAMIAPLLGLLGTVLGMIESFQQLEMAGGAANASVLAGGIWQALLTTAAGLVVAIPAAVAAHFLTERCDQVAHSIEDIIAGLMSRAIL